MLAAINDHGNVLIACKPVSSRWRYFGAILGVLKDTINTIEADYKQEGVESCMSAVIDKWLRRPVGEVADDGVLPSWRNLCVALSPIDKVLAEGIAVEHDCNYISPTGINIEQLHLYNIATVNRYHTNYKYVLMLYLF